ncbi:hypothetical protein AB0D12_40620 [Streptomyces sp. NPDC048479]
MTNHLKHLKRATAAGAAALAAFSIQPGAAHAAAPGAKTILPPSRYGY